MKRNNTFRRSIIPTEVGVSEVLSFSLIFALIISTIALVYTQAYPTLQEQKNVEVDKNIERSMSILDDNFDTVARGEAPSRVTELKVGDSKLSVQKDSYNMTYGFYRNGNWTNYTVEADVPTYRTPTETQYYYFNGAIVHKSGDNIYFVEEPKELRSKDGVLQMTLTGLNHRGSRLSGGTHTVRAIGGGGIAAVQQPASGNRTLQMTLAMETPTEPETTFWLEHFRDKPQFTNCERNSPTRFTCESAPYTEIIVQYRLVTFEYIN